MVKFFSFLFGTVAGVTVLGVIAFLIDGLFNDSKANSLVNEDHQTITDSDESEGENKAEV